VVGIQFCSGVNESVSISAWAGERAQVIDIKPNTSEYFTFFISGLDTANNTRNLNQGKYTKQANLLYLLIKTSENSFLVRTCASGHRLGMGVRVELIFATSYKNQPGL
jgi:hypothetical protein